MMFRLDPFDIAPEARRHRPGAWVLLLVGLLFAAGAAYILLRSVQQHATAAQIVQQAREAQARAREHAAPRALTPAQTEQARARQQLGEALRLSWTGLFDVLETAGHAVQGRASIVSLAPVHPEAGTAEVSITGMAISDTVMLAYVQALQRQAPVRSVQLVSHQATMLGNAEVVRFQLMLVWSATQRQP